MGWCNFEHRILFQDLTSREAQRLECEITKLRRERYNLYNIKDGCEMKNVICNDEAIKRRIKANSKKVEYKGKIYSSIKECAESVGLPYSTVSYYLKNDFDNRGFKIYESEEV